MKEPGIIRILVVEDTLVHRELLVALLQSEPGFKVVGVARDGAEAVRLVKRLDPDIVTMDVHMPEMDGYEATRQIMAEMPRPIVMISSSYNKQEHYLTYKALQMGALSILDKPTMHDTPEQHRELLAKIRMLSEVRVLKRPLAQSGSSTAATPRISAHVSPGAYPPKLVAIAASTGGPAALMVLLAQIPLDFSLPIVVVQHITVGFGQSLVDWLDKQVPLKVRIAQWGDVPQAGTILVAPDDHHMTINRRGQVELNQGPMEHGVRPSANPLFHSIAQVYADRAIGVVLTGMGEDGADGLAAMCAAGAYTIAQDEASCVVFGMPAVAIQRGAIKQVLPLAGIATAIIQRQTVELQR